MKDEHVDMDALKGAVLVAVVNKGEEHVSLDDKPPVSANVPYSSNDSSLSSLYQHYGV